LNSQKQVKFQQNEDESQINNVSSFRKKKQSILKGSNDDPVERLIKQKYS
jgi:hypothetical protein